MKFKKVMQIFYTFPNFLSWVVLAGILKSLFAGSGPVNVILDMFGLPAQNFLSDPSTFRGFLVGTDIWKNAGWAAIYYMAAIMSVDAELYEAAEIDGANRWHKIWHITLPGIREMIMIRFILAFGGIMQSGFDQIFNLYNPSVYEVADVIDTYVYRISFMQVPSFGFSTAVGMFTGIVNLVIILSVNKISKMAGGKGMFEGGVRER